MKVCVLLAILFAVAFSAPKPQWPVEFDCEFGLSAIPNADGKGSPAMVNVSSHFYYNWDKYQSSTIDYYDQCIPGIFSVTLFDIDLIY